MLVVLITAHLFCNVTLLRTVSGIFKLVPGYKNYISLFLHGNHYFYTKTRILYNFTIDFFLISRIVFNTGMLTPHILTLAGATKYLILQRILVSLYLDTTFVVVYNYELIP